MKNPLDKSVLGNQKPFSLIVSYMAKIPVLLSERPAENIPLGVPYTSGHFGGLAVDEARDVKAVNGPLFPMSCVSSAMFVLGADLTFGMDRDPLHRLQRV